MEALTIDAILRSHALNNSMKVAFRFIDGGSQETSITYFELDAKAQQIANRLRRQKRENVFALLLYPSGLEFISAFFGCLYAGVIAIPAAVPKKNRSWSNLENILKQTQAEFILTDTATYGELRESAIFDSIEETCWIVTDVVFPNESILRPYTFDKKISQPLAFLQYTSGSTSLPKGVMVSHKNIIANQQMIKEAFGHDERTVFAGWLPHFHDMGLIGNILQPIFLGIPSVLISPIAFLQQPLRWLQTISQYQATTSGAPNFAYDLCVEKISCEEKKKLDLTHWKVAFNGAEPIHAKTLKRFSEAFSSCGFEFTSFYPCYGLAETTLFAAGNLSSAPPVLKSVCKTSLEISNRAIPVKNSVGELVLVSVGTAWGSGKIAIVDPPLQTFCKQDFVGEICIQGEHVAAGYWNQPGISKEVFQAFTTEKGSFLRTGDLGFVDENGHLFITGRLKDLIIIRGRNIYPQDVELAVEQSDPTLRAHGCAVFSILKEEQEALVVVAEVEREKMRSLKPENLFLTIRQTISKEYQLQPEVIVLIKPNALPKTSSGKIQRSKCKALFLEGQLETITTSEGFISSIPSQNSIELENVLSQKIGLILHISPSKLEKEIPLNSYGIDSLKAIELQAFIESTWNVCFSFEEILEDASIKKISQRISQGHQFKKGETSQILSTFPLSCQQLGIWLDEHASQHSYGYNLIKVIKVLSLLNIVALKKTISLLMQRHPLLRARFRQLDMPIQEITPSYLPPLEEKFLIESDLEKFLEKEAVSLFNLDSGPLFRIWILKIMNSNDQYLVFTAHHLIADLWSLGIFLEELFRFYQDISQNIASAPALPPPYSDYIELQRTALKSESTHKSIEYWKTKYLKGEFWIPTNKPRSGPRTFRGSHLAFELSPEVAKCLKELALEEKTTPFVVFLSAYFLLLHLHTGERNLCLGTTAHGRKDSQFHATFGMFSHPIPLFLSLFPTWTFKTLVGEVKKVVLEGMGTHQLPFSYLLQNLEPQSDPSLRTPFQSMFVFQHVPTLSKDLNALILPSPKGNDQIQKGGLTLQPFFWHAPISTLDWTLFINETPSSYSGCFEYNCDLFSPETIGSLQAKFLFILKRCIQSSESIGSIDDILDNEKVISIEDPAPYETVTRMFLDQVKHFPDRCALVFENNSITFQALDRYSNQIARYLIYKGVFPDAVVAVKMSHSIDLVAVILAVLKTGASFLPLDPKIPSSRLESICKKSGCIFCISDKEEKKLSVDLIKLDEMKEMGTDPLPQLADADSVAYIMYTSGSTGEPKGVAISHLSLLNYLIAAQKHYQIISFAHFPFYSSIAFDLTLTSVFFPLVFGHTLHIFPESEEIGAVLGRILQHPQMTHIKLTPAHLRVLEELEISSRHITQLIVGGEQLPTTLTHQIYEKFSKRITIINEYGPTEATIGCIYFIYPSDTLSMPTLPIGEPIQNTAAYNLSSSLQPLPANITGELYLAGIDLAYGYWNEARPTAEKFLPSPYSIGSRMYKSGDLVKQTSKGVWLCLGRTDRQIKIRGYRVETEEIEASLQRHSLIKECHIIPQKLQDEVILCAYYTSVEAKIPALSNLRDFLSSTLPHYMVPSAFVYCEAIPLTSNGKVDLPALPDYKEWLLIGTEYQPPQTELQKQLVEIWASLLGQKIEKVGIAHSFFELGGDSIKVMQIVAKSRKIGLEFSNADLFENPTIKQLSDYISSKGTRDSKTCYIQTEGKVDLSPMQRWFFQHFSLHPNHYNQAVLLSRKARFEEKIVRLIFKEIAIHHEALRTLFPTSEYGIIVPYSDDLFTLEIFDYQHIECWKESMRDRIADLQSSMNIQKGPLLKMGLFTTVEGDFLFLTIHHLLVDGVSWRILLEDFDTAYKQSLDKLTIIFPEKSNSYNQWSALQTQTKLISSNKSFTVCNQKNASFSLPTNHTLQLLRDVPSAYRTQINDILLSALYMAFDQALGISKVSLFVESYGRNHLNLDLTRTIGWFTALIPTVLEVTDRQDLASVIKTIQEAIKHPPEAGFEYSAISFNYLGQFNTTEYESFAYSPIFEGLVDRSAEVPHALEIVCYILDQQFYCYASFDMQAYPQGKFFLQCYEEKLRDLIHHCLQKQTHEVTPTDFYSSSISLPEWESLVDQIKHLDSNGANAIANIYPLLPLQQGLIYEALQSARSNAYLEQVVLCLDGDLNALNWVDSLQQLINDNEILRALFFYEGCKIPHQVILKKRLLEFDYEEYTSKNFDLDAYLKRDRQKGFNLSSGPLMRFYLLRTEERRYSLIWSFHHLIVDGWSLSLLFRSLLENLSNFYQNKSLPPRPSFSLQNYFNWYMNRDVAAASSYWKQLLQTYQEQAQLPRIGIMDRRKPALIKKSTAFFTPQQVEKLKGVAQAKSLTIGSLLQAIWSLLLASYSQHEDLVFGTVSSGRNPNIPDIEQMVGLFIVTIPVRVRIAAKKKLVDIAHDIQQQILNSEQHAHIPLSEIQAHSPLKEGLIDHLFVYENYPFAGEAENLIKKSLLPMSLVSAELMEETHYGFLISFLPHEGITLEIQYDPSLYSESFVEAIPSHFELVITALSENPSITTAEIELASTNEQFFYLLNQTNTPYLDGKTLPELFHKQATENPNHIALVLGNDQVSFQELDRRSTCLASFLIRKGLDPEECVGIYMHRSLEMIISLLAVLKAGGVYLPLDPTCPIERIDDIIKETDCSIILTSASLFSRLPHSSSIAVQIDKEWTHIEESPHFTFFSPDPLQLAYVLYTSGSTGKPKGVAMSHLSVCNHISWIMQKFHLGKQDRMLQLTSFTFDVSICEFYTLFVGGTLLLAPSEANRDTLALLEVIEKEKITFLQMVPSLLETLLEKEIIKRLRSVRRVLCGADILKKEDLNHWLETCSIPITNLYGLTETCIDATYYDCQPLNLEESVPIGRPLDNAHSYVLGKHLSILPQDVPGELYIGGLGLARGYFQQPGLTAERFLPNPFHPSQRIYRTHDQVVLKSDNYLYYLGRIDQQVKIRGFRIELGEIEKALSLHPHVNRALVKAIGKDSKRYLCAYVVPKDQFDPFVLRQFLEGKLPHYMIPTHYIDLEAFPLTVHGKIDVKALPQRNPSESDQQPQSELEMQLLTLWGEVLKNEGAKIGLDQNFFDVGGSSISLMQLHYHLTQKFQYKITIENLFQYTTIRTLAGFLSQKSTSVLNIDKLKQRARRQTQYLESIQK